MTEKDRAKVEKVYQIENLYFGSVYRIKTFSQGFITIARIYLYL